MVRCRPNAWYDTLTFGNSIPPPGSQYRQPWNPKLIRTQTPARMPTARVGQLW